MSEFFVLMPFAKSNKTGQIIGIQEAERGSKCDCRCLSCNTPVTARQAEINQWHFAHRTSDSSTTNECKFSPITAVSLILRQQFPVHLTDFDLDEWPFSNIVWNIDKVIDGCHFDAYGKDEISGHTVAIEIPFANYSGFDINKYPDSVDFVLRVDTHSLARKLFASADKLKLYTSDEVFDYFLESWASLVVMHRWPQPELEVKQPLMNCSDIEHLSSLSETAKYSSTNDHGSKSGMQVESSSSICVCCGTFPAKYGKGLLCNSCVTKHVGPDFPNLTEMIRHYRKESNQFR